MRVLSWNVERLKAGAEAVAEQIKSRNADIVALQEVQISRADELAQRLADAGYRYFGNVGKPGDITTAILAKESVGCGAIAPPDGLGNAAQWWLEAKTSSFGISAVHIPPAGLAHREEFWNALLVHAGRHVGTRHMLIGDFNTTRDKIDNEGKMIPGKEYLARLCDLGWIDSWRHIHRDAREYTWRSSTNGFRVDQAWLSPTLAQSLTGARIHDEPRPEYSDHAMLVIDLK